MSPDEMKAFYRDLIETLSNQGQAERAKDFFSDDFVDHEGLPGTAPGWWKFERFVQVMKTAFPDRTVHIDFMTVDSDLLTARQTVTGTHLGPFAGREPTGKTFTISAIDIYRIRDGKVVERWGNADSIAMMQQIGLQ